MELIRGPWPTGAVEALPVIDLEADRLTLAKRRWRGQALDGADFGFDLEKPLRHGTLFFQGPTAQYVLRQKPEPLLEVPLLSLTQGTRTAWQIGNLHFPLALGPSYLWVEDDVALRQLFAREGILFHEVVRIFEPIQAGSVHRH